MGPRRRRIVLSEVAAPMGQTVCVDEHRGQDADDHAIAQAATEEFVTILPALAVRAWDGVVRTSVNTALGITFVEVVGRFRTRADTEVTAMLEIDPGRVGWRLTGELWDFPDSAAQMRMVRDVGSSRVGDLEGALKAARALAREVGSALLGYGDQPN